MFVILGLIALFSVGGLAITIAISVTNDVSSGYIPLEEREAHAASMDLHAEGADAGTAEATSTRGGGSADRPTEPAPSEPRGFDESALLAAVDGGVEPLRPPPVIASPPAAEPTPDQLLTRAHFFQGLLDVQAGQLRTRMEQARADGNDGLAQRLERQLERLESQRDPLERRIAELEDQAEDGDGEGADDEAADDAPDPGDGPPAPGQTDLAPPEGAR